MISTSIYSDQKYVVYHTTYFGDKFPANYIGSTSIDKIRQGYKGSVSSKEYKSVWQSELKTNPHLFSVEIISYHDTRSDATYKELQIQKLFNIVKNPLFVNKSYASVNGFFGMDNSNKNHPNYNKHRLEQTRIKISKSNTGKPAHNKGKSCSKETKIKLSIANTGKVCEKIICPHCGKTGGNTVMPRWHFDNCKYKQKKFD